MEGGINTYAYVGGNPISFADPYGLRTEVTIWHPAGWGASFGHVCTDINGTVYSYGRDGIWAGPASDYYAKNTFRDGQGVVVPLTPDQEKEIEACMKRDHGSYSATSNNCGSPIQDCLKESGIDTGDQMFPANVGMSLLDQGALSDANSYTLRLHPPKDQARHGHTKKIMFLILAAVGLLILIYVVCRSFASFINNYSWSEMDWNQDGSTSFSEFIESSDIGKRTLIINGKNCTEYFAFKDGLGVKTVCPKN